MRPDLMLTIIALGCVIFISTARSETMLLTLQSNPFSRPDSLKAVPPPPPPPVVVPPEEVELELTATLVSETAPMVVVNGKLLAPGEFIEGLKLVAIYEGRAVFTRGGKRFVFEIEQPGLNQRELN